MRKRSNFGARGGRGEKKVRWEKRMGGKVESLVGESGEKLSDFLTLSKLWASDDVAGLNLLFLAQAFDLI